MHYILLALIHVAAPVVQLLANAVTCKRGQNDIIDG